MPTSSSQWLRPPMVLPQNRSLSKPVYKYIRNAAGTVGTIHDPAGVLSHITEHQTAYLGDTRARYLDSHGYGAMEIEKIVSAFGSSCVEEFVSSAEGCGMSVVELEWFWSVE